MGKEDEYRRHAAKTFELAKGANSTGHRTRLLVMADAWLHLADRAQNGACKQAQKIRELHPLLRSKLFGQGSEAE
jgi:hypothetical protein